MSHEILDGHKIGSAAKQTRMRILRLLVENTEERNELKNVSLGKQKDVLFPLYAN